MIMYMYICCFAHFLQVFMEPSETTNHSAQLTNSRFHECPQCKYMCMFVCVCVHACVSVGGCGQVCESYVC